MIGDPPLAASDHYICIEAALAVTTVGYGVFKGTVAATNGADNDIGLKPSEFYAQIAKLYVWPSVRSATLAVVLA